MSNIYQENGYESRDDYLNNLAEDYDLPIEHVYTLADTLGDSEAFDGLVSTLEDWAIVQNGVDGIYDDD